MTATTKKPDYPGFSDETQAIHYALSTLAKEVLPGYEMDDAELTAAQMAKIHEAVPQDPISPVKSSLF